MIHRLAISALLLIAFPACEKGVDSPSTEGATQPVSAGPGGQNADDVVATAAAEGGADCGGDMAGKEGNCGGNEEPGGCNQWDEAAAEVAKREAPEGAEWKTVKVEGMTCGGCERRVIANVGELEGVLAVEADAELGEVRLAMIQGDSASKNAAIEKIKSLGYSVQ